MRQNLRVGGYTENLLKWFNYPHAKAHPECACHETGIVGSSVIRRGHPDSGESCIVLQSGPTLSLAAFSGRLQYANFVLQGKNALQTSPRTGVCEPLMPDVVSLSGPTFGFITREFSMVGGYTENLTKLGVGWGGLAGYGRLLGTIRYVVLR